MKEIKMNWAKCCRDCVCSDECLLRKNDDVESCEEYMQMEMDENKEVEN